MSCPEECHIKTVGAMPLVVDYIVENAAEHNVGPSPSVTVDLSETDETVILTISDDGPGIPDQEFSALDAEEETQLKHASGVGLWIVQ
nr:ATP-binding protein [Halovenus rubra]